MENEIQLAKRSTLVRYEITALKDKMVDSFFEIGELLSEVLRDKLYLDWSFQSFNDWVEQDSGLDMSARQARYISSIVERGKALGYSKDELKKIKISKLKEIFAVGSDEKVRELMAKGEDMSLEEVKAVVRPERHSTFWNLKLTKEQKEDVLEAIERVRQIHGNTVNGNGEVEDISEGRALQLLSIEFMAYAQQLQEERIKEIERVYPEIQAEV